MCPTASSDDSRLRADGSPSPQSGFSLASLLVILTVMAVFLAYTVPRMWSDVMRRERERQTIFVMKQYARAILEYQKSHAMTAPTQLAQLKDARRPRVIRGGGELLDPLTGRLDWVLVPFGAVTPGTTAPGTVPVNPAPVPQPGGAAPGGAAPGGGAAPAGGAGPGGAAPAGTDPATGQPNGAVIGPFIGVRPGISGESLISLNDQNRYEQWMYTVTDLQKDIASAIGGTTGSPAGVLH